MSLANEIQLFMVSHSELYSDMNQVQLAWIIDDCIKSNQYLYGPGEYVLLYWLINESDMDGVINKVIPKDRTGGKLLYIVECACNNPAKMKEAIKELRKLKFTGVFWHRENRPMVFPRQKGAEL